MYQPAIAAARYDEKFKQVHARIVAKQNLRVLAVKKPNPKFRIPNTHQHFPTLITVYFYPLQ